MGLKEHLLPEEIEICGEKCYLRVPVKRAEFAVLSQEQEASKGADSKDEKIDAFARIGAAALAVCLREDDSIDSAEPVYSVDEMVVALRKNKSFKPAMRAMELCGLEIDSGKVKQSAEESSSSETSRSQKKQG